MSVVIALVVAALLLVFWRAVAVVLMVALIAVFVLGLVTAAQQVVSP
jgi:hypothetical protein